MKIYTTDNDGYIIGDKDVGENCELTSNNHKGEPPFGNGYHFETGLKRPISAEILLENQKTELMDEIKEITLFQETPERTARLTELNQQYTDLCNGVPIVCKSEIEAELAGVPKKIQDAENTAKENQMLELIEGGLI